MTLNDLEIGSSGIITAVGGEGSLRQHFLDMGVIPGAEVTLIKYAPMGDPMELRPPSGRRGKSGTLPHRHPKHPHHTQGG